MLEPSVASSPNEPTARLRLVIVKADAQMYAAIILAGGRGERLGGIDKAELVGPSGRTTLERAVGTCRDAERLVVVGPKWSGNVRDGERQSIVWTREYPPYSGPARAIAKGVSELGDLDVPWVLVLACDMPFADELVPYLLAEAGRTPAFVDGIIPTTGGQRQWLCAVYRLPALRDACGRLPRFGENESVKQLIDGLTLVDLHGFDSALVDIDTPDDLIASGYRRRRRVPLNNG